MKWSNTLDISFEKLTQYARTSISWTGCRYSNALISACISIKENLYTRVTRITARPEIPTRPDPASRRPGAPAIQKIFGIDARDFDAWIGVTFHSRVHDFADRVGLPRNGLRAADSRASETSHLCDACD
jgi:hypothetical protein